MTLKTPSDLFSNYLCGFVDGEGCFSLSYRNLSRMAVGVEARPSFSIGQKQSKENYNLLKEIRDFFGGGSIRHDGKSCYKYETRSLDLITKKVIPFFETYKLRTTKRNDFIIFSSICSRMGQREHLKAEGLLRILEDSRAINTFGTRKNSIDSLVAKVKRLS